LKKNVNMSAASQRGRAGVPVTPTKTREVKYVGKREVERLFGAIPPKEVRDALLFDVIYRYGLRREEATLLRVEHVRERVRVTRVKHGISRDYPIFPRTRRLLWTYLSRRGKDDNPYLFASSQVEGAPISTSLVYQLFHRYAEAAGLPVDRRHPHVLRHSIAVHLLNAGWDLVDVQHWLGHASITSTLIYAQVSNYRINKQFRALRSSQIAAL
jgi:site-specific recombinase XerD